MVKSYNDLKKYKSEYSSGYGGGGYGGGGYGGGSPASSPVAGYSGGSGIVIIKW